MKNSALLKLLLFTVVLLSSISMYGVTRRALVIGLGTYKDSSWGKIHGDRDVPIVKDMLRNCGYSQIKTLVNSQATKKAIINAFAEIEKTCKKGDIVYIHFSGHGQQITDVNGDEDDGWDEAWIPYDAGYAYSNSYHGENHLIDDEVATWMSKIKAKLGAVGSLLLVVDACHSGDSSREAIADNEIYTRGADRDFVIPLKTKPRKTAKTQENWLTLTACKDFQTNSEVKTGKGFYGMLSYALVTGYGNFSGRNNSQSVSLLQSFVDKNRRSLPQNITLSGIVNKQSLSKFF